LLREKGEEHRRERDGREREHGREKGKAREMDGCGFSLFASPFSSCPGGILVQYRNTSAASGSKKASYVEKGKAQGGQEYEGQISNSSNCKGKSPTSENCKGKNPIHPCLYGSDRSWTDTRHVSLPCCQLGLNPILPRSAQFA